MILFSTDNVTCIDWEQHLTDIRREFGKATKGRKSLQDALHEVLIEKNNFDYLIYDHGTGEMADYITIRETDYSINVAFYHVKAMKGTNFNSDVGDIYEVTQQAIKSTIWLKSRGTLLDKIRSRRKSGRCDLLKGKSTDLEKTLKQNKLLSAKIVIVQPAISKSLAFPDKYQEVLAATNFYIKNSWRVTQLEIWGSI